MALNPYFSQGVKTEQTLYEDIIIESLKIYGQDCIYMPRELTNKDTIFSDDPVSHFSKAYRVELYFEKVKAIYLLDLV